MLKNSEKSQNFVAQNEATGSIDLFHKWLSIMNSFVIFKISLTNLISELIVPKNF